QSARTRLWHAIPLFHFLRKRPTKKNRRSLHHSAQCRKNLFATNRYPSCPAASLLPSGGLPSGLPQAPFLRALHHDQRPAETDQLEKRVPRDVPERLTFIFSSLQNLLAFPGACLLLPVFCRVYWFAPDTYLNDYILEYGLGAPS